MSDKKVAPIKPSEVMVLKEQSFPPEVLEAFNELIAKEFSDGQALVMQEDVVKLIVKKGIGRAKIFRNNWLDVEDVYRKAGWKVYFDSPGYNEDYEAGFKFSK